MKYFCTLLVKIQRTAEIINNISLDDLKYDVVDDELLPNSLMVHYTKGIAEYGEYVIRALRRQYMRIQNSLLYYLTHGHSTIYRIQYRCDACGHVHGIRDDIRDLENLYLQLMGDIKRYRSGEEMSRDILGCLQVHSAQISRLSQRTIRLLSEQQIDDTPKECEGFIRECELFIQSCGKILMMIQSCLKE